MTTRMTARQESYLLSLINQATGQHYRYLSHVREDRIGKMATRVRGISMTEASQLIDAWKER